MEVPVSGPVPGWVAKAADGADGDVVKTREPVARRSYCGCVARKALGAML